MGGARILKKKKQVCEGVQRTLTGESGCSKKLGHFAWEEKTILQPFLTVWRQPNEIPGGNATDERIKAVICIQQSQFAKREWLRKTFVQNHVRAVVWHLSQHIWFHIKWISLNYTYTAHNKPPNVQRTRSPTMAGASWNDELINLKIVTDTLPQHGLISSVLRNTTTLKITITEVPNIVRKNRTAISRRAAMRCLIVNDNNPI